MIEYTVKVFEDGTRHWYLNGERHREDGPAVERPDGSNEWYLNGQRHREDGPAVERYDGSNEWWLNGKRVTEEDVMGPKVREFTVSEISQLLGYEVKIVK